MLDSVDTLIAFVLIMLMVSLLITIVVQMMSTLFNLRGWNLLTGVRKTFAVIAPDVGKSELTFAVIDREKEKARKELAQYLLKGGLLSDSCLPSWASWWRYASAIRPSELFDAIHRIAVGKEPATKNLRAQARNLLTALGVDWEAMKKAEKEINATRETTEELAKTADEVLQKLPEADQVAKLKETFNKLTTRLEEAQKAVASQVVGAAGSIDRAHKKFEYWSCVCQERAQQWLTMHTRILTVIFAFVFAVLLQLDTVEIFKLVSSNKAVRDKLVAQAGAVEAQAAKVFGDSSTVLKAALKSWSEKETDPKIKRALDGVAVKDTDTREEVRDNVAKALDGKTTKENFDSIVNDTATQRLEKQAYNFRIVKADFDDTSFVLFPKDGCFWRGTRWRTGWSWPHITGVLFSVGLLSLGAPFWYNILKNLTNLRSVVAQNISKEQKQDQKQPNENKHKPPPLI